MLAKLDKEILLTLLNESDGLTSNQISLMLSKSSKTIQNHIHQLNGELKSYGAYIGSKKGTGYFLEINDEVLFHKLNLEKQAYLDEDIVNEVIDELLLTDDYIKSDDLIEKLYISKSKLTNCLNTIRNMLERYNLRIDIRPHKGLKIVGNEFDFRHFISNHYVQKLILSYSSSIYDNPYNQTYKKIYELVLKALHNNHYHMPLNVLEGLSRHLFVMVERIRKYQMINNLNNEITSIDNHNYKKEKAITTEIVHNIENEFDIEIPHMEYQYILINIISHKVLKRSEEQNISEDINRLVEEILVEIKTKKNIDLRDDFDLRMMLALHLVPLKMRLTFKMTLLNPLLKEIQVKCMAGYDLGIVASSVIEQNWKNKLSVHEISYLGLHFEVALNRQNESITKSNILIVCNGGRASNQMIKYNFQKNFRQYLNTIDVCDITELDRMLDNNQYDYIFTTLPIDKTTNIPILEFQFFLNETTINKIESVLKGEVQKEEILNYFSKDLFFNHIQVSNKEEAFDYIFDKLHQHIDLPEGFEDAVLKREMISSTDLIGNVAIPHPNHSITKETFIGVFVLDKPIMWKKSMVRVILLISMGKDDSLQYKPLFEMLIDVLTSQELVMGLINDPTFETLCKILQGGK